MKAMVGDSRAQAVGRCALDAASHNARANNSDMVIDGLADVDFL